MNIRQLPIIVLGSGGHAKVLIEALNLNKNEIVGAVDNNSEKVGKYIFNIPIMGNDDTVLNYSPDKILLVNGLGSISTMGIRKNLFEKFSSKGYRFANVIHPSAIIASDVQINEGVQIMAGAVIQSGTFIGKNTIINTKVSIDHDCVIGDNVHIAPGATLSGGVKLGNEVHIGTGAVIIQGMTIGAASLVAAGAVVIHDVLPNTTVMGVPGKVV